MAFSSIKTRREPLIAALLVLSFVLIGVLDWQRRNAVAQVTTLTHMVEQAEETKKGADQANLIVAKVEKHMRLPAGVAPTVATIVNVTELRKANPFYDAAENGDFLILTESRAILYRADEDRILDVLPVTIESSSKDAGSGAKR